MTVDILASLGFASVRDVPEHAARIAQIQDPKAPRLHRRSLTDNAGILSREALALYMLPPCVGIIDGQAHHEIACVLGDIKLLQQESKITNLKFRDLIVTPVDGKSEISVETFRHLRVSRRHERFEIGNGAWKHRLS